VNSGAPERSAVPAPLVAPVVGVYFFADLFSLIDAKCFEVFRPSIREFLVHGF
jgi:hypothetical protein